MMVRLKWMAGALAAGVCCLGQTILPLPAGTPRARAAAAARQATGLAGQPERPVTVYTGDNVIPQMVDGDTWKTSCTFVNLDTATVEFNVLFIDDSGNPMALPVAGLATTEALKITLPVRQSASFETEGRSATLKQGFAYLQRQEQKVGGLCVFRQSVYGRPAFEAVVPVSSESDRRQVLLFDNTQGFSTGMAIANAHDSAASVEFQIRAEDGTLIETRTIDMAAWEHRAFALPAVWTSTAGRKGSIEVQVTGSAWGVSVLGLRFDPNGAFTSFHALKDYFWQF